MLKFVIAFVDLLQGGADLRGELRRYSASWIVQRRDQARQCVLKALVVPAGATVNVIARGRCAADGDLMPLKAMASPGWCRCREVTTVAAAVGDR